jgi:hypothetical protein
MQYTLTAITGTRLWDMNLMNLRMLLLLLLLLFLLLQQRSCAS